MARFKNVDGKRIPFAPEEELARDAEEAAEASKVYVPQSVSKLQAELAAGESVVSQIEEFMNAPESPWAMKRAWSSATTLERNSQMVDELAYVLMWDESQIDQLFIDASGVMV